MEHHSQTERQEWMRVLALSDWRDVKVVTANLATAEHKIKRVPETGLVMVRGRIGGSGSTFNVGEASVTRCCVKITDKVEGHAYVMGRNKEHALMAALCDGLMQFQDHRSQLEAQVIQPLRLKLEEKRQRASQQAAATKVDFFTLVRGDG